jgi:hypothetical protein
METQKKSRRFCSKQKCYSKPVTFSTNNTAILKKFYDKPFIFNNDNSFPEG